MIESASKNKWFSAILGLLILVLVFLCILLFRQYRSIQRVHPIHSLNVLMLQRHKGPLNATETGEIASWMTFQYVNVLFNVPPSYIQQTLAITDSTYPRLTLATYARKNHQNSSTIVAQVQAIVNNYLVSHPR